MKLSFIYTAIAGIVDIYEKNPTEVNALVAISELNGLRTKDNEGLVDAAVKKVSDAETARVAALVQPSSSSSSSQEYVESSSY